MLRLSRRIRQYPAAFARRSILTERKVDVVTQRIPVRSWRQTVLGFPKRNPFATNMLIVTGLTPFADYQMQKMEGIDWDVQRSCAFLAFGVYNGIMQWVVYVSVFSRLFPGAVGFANMTLAEKMRDRSGMMQLLGQIVMDLGVYMPLVYFPVFHSFRGYFSGLSIEQSLEKYKQNFGVDNFANWVFWVPGDILCFAAPVWARLPISHAEGFLWNSVLSWLHGDAKTPNKSVEISDLEGLPFLSALFSCRHPPVNLLDNTTA